MKYFLKKLAEDNYIIVPEYDHKIVMHEDGTGEMAYIRYYLQGSKLCEENTDFCFTFTQLVHWDTNKINELIRNMTIDDAVLLEEI